MLTQIKGIKMGLSRHKSVINQSVERGLLLREEQRESLGKVTTHSGNIETIAVPFALIGVGYIFSILMAKLFVYVPVIGPVFSNMLFIW